MKIFILALLFSQSVFAANEYCWRSEINARTQVRYDSPELYNQDLGEWKQKGIWANPLQLIKAYKVYRQEKENSLRLESDKMGHCYMGCRIRQKTDFRTVQYVAWLKELQDITDCDPNTHFEDKDYQATVLGGSFSIPAANCENKCREELPKIL